MCLTTQRKKQKLCHIHHRPAHPSIHKCIFSIYLLTGHPATTASSHTNEEIELQSLMKLVWIIWNFPGQGFCFHLCNSRICLMMQQHLLKVGTWGQNVSNELWWGPATAFLLKNVHSKGKITPLTSPLHSLTSKCEWSEIIIFLFKRHHRVPNGKACKKPPQKPNTTQISGMKVLTESVRAWQTFLLKPLPGTYGTFLTGKDLSCY